jgi:hypothetical protein
MNTFEQVSSTAHASAGWASNVEAFMRAARAKAAIMADARGSQRRLMRSGNAAARQPCRQGARRPARCFAVAPFHCGTTRRRRGEAPPGGRAEATSRDGTPLA